MTEHVRTRYRNHRKTTWAGVLVVLVLAALVIALPALAEHTDSSNGVAPASGQGVLPSILNLGGSNFSCASAGSQYGSASTPSGMREFRIEKPTRGSYTDPATGVTFDVSRPSAGKDPASNFSFSVRGNAAAVYHVGVKGGTKIAWYDYFNNAPGGVLSDTDLHSTPDSKYNATTNPPNYTFFVASITTFCYKPVTDLTVTPDCDSPFPGHKLGGTGGTVLYEAQLVPKNGQCKTDNVVMYSFTPGENKLFATLNPVAPDGDVYEVVEHIHWDGITHDGQNPVVLWYDDDPPYDGGNKIDMVMCNSDPRTAPFVLGPHASLMPTGHTTCMLESTDSAGDGPNARTYDAWIFSTVDGGRGMG